MKKRSFGRLLAAVSTSLLLVGAAAPAVHAAPPTCDHPEFCEWEFECLYIGPDGNPVLSCRLIKRCYC